MQTRLLLATAIADLGLLWVASSIVPGKGLLAFGLGVGVLAWSLWRASRGERQTLYRTFLLVLLCAATVSGLEGVLVLFPGLVSGRLANYTFGGYHADRGGIYRLDPHVGRRMRSGFRRRLYWNGHWWTHETNADGYRGPRLAKADAVFLGDSLVYGHGVEEDETVPAQVGRLAGLASANLGQPGIGILQALALFEEMGARLRPSRVFVCVHHNDAEDSLDAYPVAALEAFLRRPDELPLVRPELREPRSLSLFDRWADSAAVPLRGARLIAGLRGKTDWVLRAPARERGESEVPYVPSPQLRDMPYPPLQADAPPELRLAWRASRQALAELLRLADGELVIFDLGYPREFTEGVESMARELGAAYSPAGRLALSRALAGEPIYLAADGHWTPRGCEVVARELLRSLPRR